MCETSANTAEQGVPVHMIEIIQPPKAILHADVNMNIFSAGSLLGELKISKGSIDWRAANQRKATKVTWERFARIMAEVQS